MPAVASSDTDATIIEKPSTNSTTSGTASTSAGSVKDSLCSVKDAANARDLLPVDWLVRKTFLTPETNANKFLQGVPLFKRLPEADIPLLAQAMQVKHFPAGIEI